jgi:hypothetical protein
MLRSLDDLLGYSLDAIDGEVGAVRDFLFDEIWAVRYLDAACTARQRERRVAITTLMLGWPDREERRIPLPLTRERIASDERIDAAAEHATASARPRLHSAAAAIRPDPYVVETSDGPLGSVLDLLAEDQSWVIRYLVVTIGSPRHNRRVLISPAWGLHTDWQHRVVQLTHDSAHVHRGPDFVATECVNPAYQRRLDAHYGHGESPPR